MRILAANSLHLTDNNLLTAFPLEVGNCAIAGNDSKKVFDLSYSYRQHVKSFACSLSRQAPSSSAKSWLCDLMQVI